MSRSTGSDVKPDAAFARRRLDVATENYEHTTFARLISEGALEIGDGYRAKNDELGGQGLIFLRAGHVTNTHIDFSGADRFYAEAEQRVQSKLAKPGDAVVTTKGNSTGRTAFVTRSMPSFVYCQLLGGLKPSPLGDGFSR